MDSEDYFSHYFLDYGIAFVGDQKFVDIILTVKEGDRIILKEGKTIKAVGVIEKRNGKVNGSNDLKFLSDIDGWLMPGYCFVKYYIPKNPLPEPSLTIATITGINKDEIKNIVDDLINNLTPKETYLPLPNPTNDVRDFDIIEELVKFGLSPSRSKKVSEQISRIRLLASYYYRNISWDEVREHETRSFLVIPLLLALGWPEQNIKIEYPNPSGKIDIAIFNKPFKSKEISNSECKIIIETKGFDKGLGLALSQAEGYSKHFPKLELIALTNGYCYKIFKFKNEKWELDSYINLLNPQDKYPIFPSISGALNTLQNLLPK